MLIVIEFLFLLPSLSLICRGTSIRPKFAISPKGLEYPCSNNIKALTCNRVSRVSLPSPRPWHQGCKGLNKLLFPLDWIPVHCRSAQYIIYLCAGVTCASGMKGTWQSENKSTAQEQHNYPSQVLNPYARTLIISHAFHGKHTWKNQDKRTTIGSNMFYEYP